MISKELTRIREIGKTIKDLTEESKSLRTFISQNLTENGFKVPLDNKCQPLKLLLNDTTVVTFARGSDKDLTITFEDLERIG